MLGNHGKENIIKVYLVSNCMSFLHRQRFLTILSLGSNIVSSEQNMLISFEWQCPWSPLLFKALNFCHSFMQNLRAELTVVIKLVRIGWNDAFLLVSKVVTDLLMAVLFFAEAPLWPRRRLGFSVFLIVTEEGGCLVPMTLTIGLQVRCNRNGNHWGYIRYFNRRKDLHSSKLQIQIPALQRAFGPQPPMHWDLSVHLKLSVFTKIK